MGTGSKGSTAVSPDVLAFCFRVDVAFGSVVFVIKIQFLDALCAVLRVVITNEGADLNRALKIMSRASRQVAVRPGVKAGLNWAI
jgi:hypothetical protein